MPNHEWMSFSASTDLTDEMGTPQSWLGEQCSKIVLSELDTMVAGVRWTVQKVTIELSENAIQRAEEIAQRTGRGLEAVLTDWIERGAVQSDLATLVSTEQYIYTPLGGEDTAEALSKFLQSKQRATDN